MHCAKNRATVKLHETTTLDLWVKFLLACKQLNYPLVRVKRTQLVQDWQSACCRDLWESRAKVKRSPAFVKHRSLCLREDGATFREEETRFTIATNDFILNTVLQHHSYTTDLQHLADVFILPGITSTYFSEFYWDFMQQMTAKQDIIVKLNENLIKGHMYTPL